jgi:hypothetical protein
VSFFLSNATFAGAESNETWETVAENLQMPYGILVKSQKVYVSTIPSIGIIDEDTGGFDEKTALANGSPAGFIKDKSGFVVVENGTGRLLSFDRHFVQSSVLAEGLGDPITVKETNDAYLVVDYNFGLPNGRLLKIDKKAPSPATPEVLLLLDGPGSFYIDMDNSIYISKFDSGDLVEFNSKIRVNQDGFLVSDFGGFDTTGRLLFVSNDGGVAVLNSNSISNPTGLFASGKYVYTADMIGGKLLKIKLENLLCSDKHVKDLNKKFCKK